MRRVLAAAWVLLGPTTVWAQSPEVAPAPEAASAAEENVGSPRSAMGVADRFIASMYGLEPAGDPEVLPSAARNGVVLRAPMRLVREGALAGDLAMGQVRMKAGVRVAFRRFTGRTALATQDIEAWCGSGEINQWGWRPIVVCMILTPDGRANLATPSIEYGSWWSIASITPGAAAERIDRVEVLPVTDPTRIDLELVLDRVQRGQVKLRRRLVGPDVSGKGQVMPRAGDLPLPLRPGDVASYVYDGLALTLTADTSTQTVAVASERVAPSLDAAFEEAGGFTRALEAAVDHPDEIKPTPFVVGGVRFDPTALTVDGQAQGPRGVLARGMMQHARTARVTRDIEMGTALNARIPEGTPAHEVEIFRPLALGDRTSRFWCAPVSALTVFGRQNDQTTCFRPSRGGFEGLWPDQGRSWLVTTSSSTTPVLRRASELPIEVSETDLIGPMDVRLEVQRITREQITIRVFARRDDEDALMLTIVRPIEDGRVVLPMWTHRLTLTITDGKALAVLTEDGDGEGLPAVGVYP